MKTMIPKIFHQIWMGWDLPEPPPAAEKYKQTWAEHHPDWEFRLWSALECRNLVAEHYAWFLEKYDAYAFPIQKADAIRYFILHHFGGVYIDHDYVCVKNISPSLSGPGCCYIPLEPIKNSKEWWVNRWNLPTIESAEGISMYQRLMSNAMMASVRNCKFWEAVHQAMFEAPQTIIGDPSIDVLESTGPVMLTRAYHAYNVLAEVNIVLPSLWQPISAHEGHTLHGFEAWKNETEKRGAYACHVWNCSTKNTTGGVEGMTSWAHQDPVVKKK